MPIIQSDKPKKDTPSAGLKQLTMYIEPTKKNDLLLCVQQVEQMEVYSAQLQKQLDNLKDQLEQERDGDASLLQAMQARVDQQEVISRTERRVFLLTVAKVKGWDLSGEEAATLADF